jgi:hypothetical protein
MNHAKTLFSTEMFAGAITSVVQYLATLLYSFLVALGLKWQPTANEVVNIHDL